MRPISAILLASALAAFALPARAQEPTKKADPVVANDALKEAIVRFEPLATPNQAAASPTIGGRLVSIPELPPTDPHHPVMLKLREAMNQSCATCHAAGVTIHRDDLLGLVVTPADPAIRDQLKLEGAGLVVTAVAPKTHADSAGIKEKDILIASATKPLATVDDLRAAIKAAGAGPVGLRLMRGGETTMIAIDTRKAPAVVADHRTTVDFHATPDRSFWIGVTVNPADDTLRSHLKLPDGVGLVVADVIKQAPAEKAGVKVNDVFLTIDDQEVKAVTDLVQSVQKAKESPLKIKFRRRGTDQFLTVKPEPRKDAEINANHAEQLHQWLVNSQVLRLYQPGQAIIQEGANPASFTEQLVPLTLRSNSDVTFVATPAQKATVDKLDAEVRDLSVQVKELQEAIKALNATLKEKKPQGR